MDGLFTTIRVRQGVAWFMQDHLARLGAGEELAREVLAAAEGLADARVRVTRLAGRPLRIEAEAYAPPVEPWRLAPVRVSPEGDKVRRKTVERTMYDAARAQAGGADDALLHLADGQVLECTIANVFFVCEKALLTPPATAPLLAGIARNRVLTAAGALGLEVREADVRLDELNRMDGCFVTNALMVAHPVTAIEGLKRFEELDLARRLREVLAPNDRERPYNPSA